MIKEKILEMKPAARASLTVMELEQLNSLLTEMSYGDKLSVYELLLDLTQKPLPGGAHPPTATQTI